MGNKIQKVHCFFEQSGTFKQAFLNLGIPAFDYDIQNNFGQTDYQIDLFAEIEKAYAGGASIFDAIEREELIMAFFPCIYFCANSQMMFSFSHHNYVNLSVKEKTDLILERSRNRECFFRLAVKMMSVAESLGLRLIMENPWSQQTFLKANFVQPPSLIDNDRTLRGDYYTKPTAYWYINIEPTYGMSLNRNLAKKRVVGSGAVPGGGICSEERSMISPEYAKNFIADFILGVSNENTLPSLF